MTQNINPLYFQLFAPPRGKGDVRKAALVEQAILQIADQGLESMTLESIGKPLGVRRSHVVYYFKDRDEVFLTAAKLCFGTLQAITVEMLKKQQTTRKRLLAIHEANIKWVNQYPGYPTVLLTFLTRASRSSADAKLYAEMLDAGQKRVTAILKESGMTAVRAEAATGPIHNVLFGTLVTLSCSAERPLSKSKKTWATTVVEQTLQSIL
jgi:AcrR family transcriptional regulator